MKNVVKRPLKLMAVAAFMVALGYGVSTNSKVSELSSSINLSALSSVSAQGETGGGGNTVTCYSTFMFWPSPIIVRDCADCRNYYFMLFRDPGECTVSP